jgi:hypothetical protein
MSSERERISRRIFEAEYRAEQEKPVKEAAEQLARTTGEYRRVLADNLRRWKDPERYCSERLDGVTLDVDTARAFNEKECDLFIAECPEFYPCEKNQDAMLAYLELNGLSVVDSKMFRKCFERLSEAGLLSERPVEAEPVRQNAQRVEPVEEDFASIPRLSPYTRYPMAHYEPSVGKMNGRDLQTGEYREFSEKEIEDMSADTFKKVFELTTVQDQERNQGPVLL